MGAPSGTGSRPSDGTALPPNGFDPSRKCRTCEAEAAGDWCDCCAPMFKRTVAALYVETGGCYFGLDGVDPWDVHRDARKYAGPYPVVAHPPCDRWHQLSAVNHKRWGFAINEDGGCFSSALAAVRRWGGVLEHPAETRAFKFHGIPEPSRGWQQTIDGDWTVEVDQAAYGHRARKRTWLLYSGSNPPLGLDLRETRGSHQIGLFDRKLPVMKKQEALETPPAFRDLLLDLARNAPPSMNAEAA